MTVRLPSYRLHKPSGRAVVTINGRDHYLGPHGSPESLEAYGRLIAQYSAGRPITLVPDRTEQQRGPTINEIALVFMRHAQSYYVKNGEQTDEVACIRSALTPLCILYGDTPAKDFGPLALKAVRQRMIDVGGKRGPWSRDYINKSIERIRRAFRHAVSNELIPKSIGGALLVALKSVDGLEAGRTTAKDYPRRYALPQAKIDAVREIVNVRTRDVMDLCLLTGARPGEVVSLTGAMINRDEDIWYAELTDHKMAHRGKSRVLVFGPKAQAILARYLPTNQRQRLFPVRRQTVSDNIKRACEVAFDMPEELREKRRKGEEKLTDAQRAKAMAWRRANAFTCHWMRHCSGTAIRKSHGLDATQATLGHASRATTERYASPVTEAAKQVARERG